MKHLIKKILKEEVFGDESEKSDNGETLNIDPYVDSDSYEETPLKLKTDPVKGVVAPSKKVISDVCEKEEFCKKQGPITFGQLRVLVENAQKTNLLFDLGEGGYKASIRLLPWFLPQIAIAGFIGSSIRAFNKIIRPGLEDTRGYKSWWGRTVLRVMDIAEGDISKKDPISKIFFISDGLLHMMDKKFKLKFARYIAELAASKPDSEPVPEYFVENELRAWVNQKFLLNPPLPPKTLNESEDDDWGWAKEIEIETDLTPAQIYNRYDAFPLEVVGPYIAGQFNDVVYEGGKLYLEVDGWFEFVDLFEDRESGYGYMGRYLARAVLSDDDFWEPYDPSDLVSDWVDDVWDLVTDDEVLLEYVKKHIREGSYIGESLYSGEELTEEMLDDISLLGELINDEEMFHDLKIELKWAYGSAYNQAASNNVYEAATDAVIDIFGKGEWIQKKNSRGYDVHLIKFDATDVILESVSNEISDCWSGCRKYYDPERHYDSEEHESEEQAFEEFCEECVDKPFDNWSYFLAFYSSYLEERDDELNPRYDEWPDSEDLKEYFREDVYNRI
jgi:hypothetical protein